MTRENKFIATCFLFLAVGWLTRGTAFGLMGFCLFLTWNLLLATVPLLLAGLMRLARVRLRGTARTGVSLLLVLSWMLFLPNAFYLLTDFMHLNQGVLVNMRDNMASSSLVYERGDGLYIFDSFLLFLSALYGAFVGALALLHAYVFFKKKVTAPLRIALMAGIVLLSALGVYIGRYGRWNSWDAFTNPFAVTSDLIQNHMTGPHFGRFILVVVTMIIFQIISFLLVKGIWHVPHADSGKEG